MFGLPFYPAHNVIHVVTGLPGLWAGLSKGANGPRTFSQLFGAAYTLMAIAGFFGLHDLGSLHLGFDGNFNGIHLVLGLLGMLVGFAGPVTVVILATVGRGGERQTKPDSGTDKRAALAGHPNGGQGDPTSATGRQRLQTTSSVCLLLSVLVGVWGGFRLPRCCQRSRFADLVRAHMAF